MIVNIGLEVMYGGQDNRDEAFVAFHLYLRFNSWYVCPAFVLFAVEPDIVH